MITVAIDGPAGAGKSTVARLLAKQLGAVYIDTGAMYRALTYKALQLSLSLENEDRLVELLEQTDIQLQNRGEQQVVLLDGQDVTEAIRSPEVNRNVSIVAKHGKVRERMVERQRELARSTHVVMDGRDIGTKVLPNAPVKVFLTASVEERARRRYQELKAKGYQPNLDEIKAEIEKRDRLDRERTVSPLQKADDAIEIDTTNMTIEEVIELILKICRRKTA